MPDKARSIAAEPQPEPHSVPQPATQPAPRKAVETGPAPAPNELGGREGPEPVRYGDWEKNGRCIDF